MIASVTGSAQHVGLDRVVVSVGGVGMLVHTPPAVAAACRTGSEVTLATSLVVREDSLTLYGFDADGTRDTFELLMTVSGVGPRVALAILSVLTPDTLATAVGSEDVRTLTKVPGIGKKGAERLVLELRDKIGVVPGAVASAPVEPVVPPWRTQVLEALVGLGYSASQAEGALDRAAAGLDGTPDVSAALRAALRELAG
ncbi:Holliday junction branch migration protein RuvA [Janibacter melonis]|uniref:Holliday junction branch migration complex subunit RuvA n=1 Tax=Janibacter melonis TaxID=262209 RepID=A0A650GS50_9MICO|nr:Holliday junction branch migration protein RuvA [Janibacter melonis]QGX08350.1 Holliday junction branch migration protein RuvA [Janibacter melonis]